MNQDLSIVNLALHASPVVQLIMALLLAASVGSWAIIFRKGRVVKQARGEAERFEQSFWSGGDLGGLYRGIEQRGRAAGMESIFESGFREFARQRKQGVSAELMVDGARRAMRVAQIKEIDRLEDSLATLATVGSTSPYVGLFGTVWGIMSAFSSLGNVQQATLAAVAPGITEALIATAIGLFAAIPAVIAYNQFADRIGRLELRYDAFMEEFSALLQRHSVQPASQ
jgi:biopolymer transport protein TolQ